MWTKATRWVVLIATLLAGAVAGCTAEGSRDMAGSPSQTRGPTSSPVAAAASPTVDSARALPRGVSEPPSWLGSRVLPTGPSGYGIAHSTPPILRDRRLRSIDVLPPPRSEKFESSVTRVPRSVLRRSTWRPACPVDVADLSYVRVSFWGFDERAHTGEVMVNRSVARDVVSVFRVLYRQRWPIEEMRVTTKAELDAPPTGDGNNTGSFVCRPSRTSEQWSEHAFGLAIDVNPFHNPYVRDDLVLPERAIAYRNRGWRRPGMIYPGDVVTKAFERIGWEWGGSWMSAKDWMHFSSSGR